MPLDLTPAVTGCLRYVESEALVIDDWLGELATGDEYGGAFVLAKVSLAGMWGIEVHEVTVVTQTMKKEADRADRSLQGLAATLARESPAVEVGRPVVPTLTGDLLEDVRAVSGLTLGQIAQATGVSERAVATWRAGSIPRHREEFLSSCVQLAWVSWEGWDRPAFNAG